MVWGTPLASGARYDVSGAVFNVLCVERFPSPNNLHRSCPAWRRLSLPQRLFYSGRA
jgi:hypothetical protein